MARKWTELECECTMRPRLRRSYRPSTARPCTRGNRETIRAWSLTLPSSSSSWTDEKSCQGLFLYNLKNRILETTFVIIFFSFLFILLRFFYDSRYSRIFLFLDITDWSTSLFKLIQIQYILKIFLRLEREGERIFENGREQDTAVVFDDQIFLEHG